MKINLQTLFLVLISLVAGCGFANPNEQQPINDSIILVGTQNYIWNDQGRKDPYYGETRKINVRVWYPADETPTGNKPTSYLIFSEKLYKKLNGWSASDFEAEKKIRTGSFTDAPILKSLKKAPLLIFSPSLGGNLSYYTYYAEFFAQKGFVVMGINHLYESEVVIDNKDNIFSANHHFHDSLKSLKIPEEITADGYREALGARQKILAKDIVFALDQLLADPGFGSKIDIDKIGVFGHSAGGAAAVYSSILDKRIKAVVNLDGTPPSIALKNGISVPFLFIEDLTDYHNHQGYATMHKRRSDFCTLNRAESWRILIKGFNHNSFLDINYYFAKDTKTAKAEQEKLNMILNYMDAFYCNYLVGENRQGLEPVISDKLEIIRFKK